MIRFRIRGRAGDFAVDAAAECASGPLVLVGPNGAGKTTLLSMLLGVRQPEDGRVEVGGTVLYDGAAGINVPTEDRGLGYVPQGNRLFPHLTVLENAAFGIRAPAPERRARALAALQSFGVDALADRYPDGLSGGEAQRVALARALAPSPRALFLDEPLASLDVAARRQAREFLAERLRALSIPALLVTHDPADARALGARVAVVDRGRVVQTGTPAELAASPASPFVAELFRPA